MTDEAVAAPVAEAAIDAPRGRRRRRVHAAVRTPANWLQLVRFATVGASGYVVNLAVYALLVQEVGLHFRLASVCAFVVAVANNFVWNRAWTFRGSDGHVGFQAMRFYVVSVAAFGFGFVLLNVLVAGFDVEKVTAQAVAVAAAMPLNFIGNKLWSFRS
jgi:putative flippase GtrA